ncbi:MAG: AAA family ATPase [Desulfitobacteriaceae bacterium]
MITLNELRKMAENIFPGKKIGLAEILTVWAINDTDGSLENILKDSGMDRDGMVEALKPLIDAPDDQVRKLFVEFISSVSGAEINGGHLIEFICRYPQSKLAQTLTDKGISLQLISENLGNLKTDETVFSSLGIQVEAGSLTISSFGRNLTQLAEQGAFEELCDLPEEINRITDVLLRKRKGNPILTGEAGVGKTAIVELLARDIVKNPNTILNGCKVVEVSMGKLVAGTKYRGEFEQRMEEVLDELSQIQPAILFIDEIHLLLGAGRAEGGAMDGANLLKPYLARDGIRVIGATTNAEYMRYIASDEALERRFQQIAIKEPNYETVYKMVSRQAKVLSEHHDVQMGSKIVESAIKLTDRYMKNRRQPDKSIDLLDSTAVAVRRKGFKIIEADDLLEKLAELTGVPVGVLTGKDKAVLMNLAKALKQKVLGQNDAIDKLVPALIHRRMDLGSEERPAGVFLFAGDTGVGKTELARGIAGVFFGSPKKLIHIDLGEYSGPAAVHKLIGAPAGLVGSEDEGVLIRGLQAHSPCVILFDEIEKANPEVHKLLLGLLDNGRISSAKGKSYDATGCVIILTTNAVSSRDLEKKSLGFARTEEKHSVLELLTQTFPREFLGRMDEIVPFRKLLEDDYKKIMELRLNEALIRLKDKGITVKYDREKLLHYLLSNLETGQSGARGIARILERKLLQPLAVLLLEMEEGKTVVLDEKFYQNGVVEA